MRPPIAIKAFLAAALWGASFAATKLVLRELSPISVIILRFALGLGALIFIVHLKQAWAFVPLQDLGWFLFLGFNGIFLHQLLQVNGLVSTSATNTGWMVALIPIFTALLGWLLLGESFVPVQVMGLALAVLGTLLVISRGEFEPGTIGLPATRGDLLVFLSAPNWAIFSVLSKRLLSRYPPSFTMAVTMGLGWLMLLPLFVAAAGWRELPGLSLPGWAGLIFLGLFCSGLAYVFWYDALEAAGAGQVASFLYLEPLVTLIVAMFLLEERPRIGTLMGGGLILTGVWLVNHHRGRPV